MNRWIIALVLFALVAMSFALPVVQELQDDARGDGEIEASGDGDREIEVSREDIFLQASGEETSSRRRRRRSDYRRRRHHNPHRHHRHHPHRHTPGHQAPKIPCTIKPCPKKCKSAFMCYPDHACLEANKKCEETLAALPATCPSCMWRQTGSCDANGGHREPGNDKRCTAIPPTGASGFCDCNGNNAKDADERGYGCGSSPPSCNAVCSCTQPPTPAPSQVGDTWAPTQTPTAAPTQTPTTAAPTRTPTAAPSRQSWRKMPTKCWRKMPTGCARALSEPGSKGTGLAWFIDPQSPDSATCTARTADYNIHCGKSDALTSWGSTVVVTIGQWSRGTKTVGPPPRGYICPSVVSKANWVRQTQLGETRGDTFKITQSVTGLSARRTDHPGRGTGQNLEIMCASNIKESSKCWRKMPTGCARDLSGETSSPRNWFIDPHSPTKAICGARAVIYNWHCGKSDALTQWVVKP